MNARKWIITALVTLLLAALAGSWTLSSKAEEGSQTARQATATTVPTAEPTVAITATATTVPTAEPTVAITATATTVPTAEPTVAITATAEPDIKTTEYLYPEGFTMASEAVDVRDVVQVRGPAGDISDYFCFPQDYSEGDSFNRGCQKLQEDSQLPWTEPLAGFSYDYNDACRDVSRHCNIQIPTWNWMAVSGEEFFLPGLGSLRDPDGGAALAVILNAWEIPGEWESAYVLHGWFGTGEVWNMEDLQTTWNEDTETYGDNQYGAYSVETVETIRDHFIFKLAETEDFRGQCSRALNCHTVSWVIGFRWYDGSFHVIGSGQYVANPTP